MGIHVIKIDNVSNSELHEGSGESPTSKHNIAYNIVLLKWRPCLGLLISATVSAAAFPPTHSPAHHQDLDIARHQGLGTVAVW